MTSSVPSPWGPGVVAGAAGPRCSPGLLWGQMGTGGAGQGHHGGQDLGRQRWEIKNGCGAQVGSVVALRFPYKPHRSKLCAWSL